MFTHVHVKKVKETETGGKPTTLNAGVLFRYEYGTGFTCGGVNPMNDEVRTFKPLEPSIDFDDKCPF
jgi:hypothetical protein